MHSQRKLEIGDLPVAIQSAFCTDLCAYIEQGTLGTLTLVQLGNQLTTRGYKLNYVCISGTESTSISFHMRKVESGRKVQVTAPITSLNCVNVTVLEALQCQLMQVF